MITGEDITLRVVDALNLSGHPYMLVGSFSTNLYGVPRSTKDADFVLEHQGELSPEFYAALGDELEVEPQLRFETNTGTFKQEIACRSSEFKVELFRLSKDAFDQERFRRRRSVTMFERTICVPTAEDVVVMKLRWFRKKDWPDIVNVLAVQRGKLDWTYIENWCRQHGTMARLEEIRREVPEI